MKKTKEQLKPEEAKTFDHYFQLVLVEEKQGNVAGFIRQSSPKKILGNPIVVNSSSEKPDFYEMLKAQDLFIQRFIDAGNVIKESCIINSFSNNQNKESKFYISLNGNVKYIVELK